MFQRTIRDRLNRILESSEFVAAKRRRQFLRYVVEQSLDGESDRIKQYAIAVEAPTYLGALQAFDPYEPDYIRMDTDEDGLIPASLDETLQRHPVKFIYLVPTFQNPTGRTLPLERRKQIAEIVVRHGALLVEDDPYSALRYRGERASDSGR